MSESFTYTFADGTLTDTINVEVGPLDPSSDGYPVTAVSGFLGQTPATGTSPATGGTPITGESGMGGAVQADQYNYPFDNTVFAKDSAGANNAGSTYGVDDDGIEFTVGSDLYDLYTSGGTFVIENETKGFDSTLTLLSSNAPCYCAGTLILTDSGERPVEGIVIGDVVVTASGAHRPVKWVGRRTYAGRFLAANPAVHPIRFRAGCLGEGLPRRDLLVSPEHAMVLDGLLIPAHALVNGETITREPGLARVEYVHLELDTHDVLLAEGATAESFVNHDSRGLFQNAAEYQGSEAAVLDCLPRVESGQALEAIRARLAAPRRQAA